MLTQGSSAGWGGPTSLKRFPFKKQSKRRHNCCGGAQTGPLKKSNFPSSAIHLGTSVVRTQGVQLLLGLFERELFARFFRHANVGYMETKAGTKVAGWEN